MQPEETSGHIDAIRKLGLPDVEQRSAKPECTALV